MASAARWSRIPRVNTLLRWVAMLIFVMPADGRAQDRRRARPRSRAARAARDGGAQRGDQVQVEHRVPGGHGVRGADRDGEGVDAGRAT